MPKLMPSTYPKSSRGWHAAEHILGPPETITFRAAIGSTNTRIDVWEPGTPFPLFGPTGVVAVTSTNAGDDGDTVTVSGLDDQGFSQEETVEIGAGNTTSKWRAPLAQIILDGASGIRVGSLGRIDATVAGVLAAQISVGGIRSSTSCREVRANERWVVTAVTASIVRDGSQGNQTSVVFGSLMAAHPGLRVYSLGEFRGGGTIDIRGSADFLAGAYFFVTAQTDVITPVITGRIDYEVYAKLPV